MIGSVLLRRPRRSLMAAFAAAFILMVPASAQEGAKLFVELDAPGRLAYTGDPNRVSILFKNIGGTPWTNPGMNLEDGLQVYNSEGRELKKIETQASARESQPQILEPNGYFGKVINLNLLFPDMKKAGSYRITWSGPGVEEQSIVSRVIKKYDQALNYQGVIHTEFGNIVVEFYKDLAPRHVKNFIDLANQGFYDGKLFHRTIKGSSFYRYLAAQN